MNESMVQERKTKAAKRSPKSSEEVSGGKAASGEGRKQKKVKAKKGAMAEEAANGSGEATVKRKRVRKAKEQPVKTDECRKGSAKKPEPSAAKSKRSRQCCAYAAARKKAEEEGLSEEEAKEAGRKVAGQAFSYCPVLHIRVHKLSIVCVQCKMCWCLGWPFVIIMNISEAYKEAGLNFS